MSSMCKNCKHHRNDNSEMKASGQNTQAGSFCLKFGWNLGRVKNWIRKQSTQKGIELPRMTKLPKNCLEWKWL